MMTRIDTEVPALEPWGSIENLGAEVLEGDVQCMGRMVHGAPTDPVSCAWFGATRGRFRMVYPFDEHSVVVEGSVTLTDEATGTATTYGVGDAWFVKKGTPVLWDVTSERFVKNYLAVA
ncbi:MAG: cupin domain-containing protein [Paracoccus aminovorans]|nr:cupin domain-containing protein [Paracoccus aminovorans]